VASWDKTPDPAAVSIANAMSKLDATVAGAEQLGSGTGWRLSSRVPGCRL